MEDQFANILQRNYGLKAVGKLASLGARSNDRASASAQALERGKSVGSGLGRIHQLAAAAMIATAGDGMGMHSSHGHNGLSKSSGRQSDGPLQFGSALEQGFRGATK